MRVIAATALFAGIASADLAGDLEKAGWEISCGLWKSGVAFGKEGWTSEQVNGKTVWKKDGTEVKDWSGYEGYGDSKCDKLGAAYLTAAAATVAAVAALAF